MNWTNLFDWLFNQYAIGGMVLTYLIHSTLFFILAWSISRFGFLNSPVHQQFLWKAALFGGIITASLSYLLPGYPLRPEVEITRNIVQEVPVLSDNVVTAINPGSVAAGEVNDNHFTGHLFHLSAFAPLFLIAWLTIALFLIIREYLQHTRFLNSIDPRLSIGPGFHMRALGEMVKSAGLSSSPKITYSKKLNSPIVIGGREICLPERAFSLNTEEQRSLIAHELAHIYRGDFYWQLLIQTIKHIFFFQPLNRIMITRIQSSTELLCDAWAVNQKVNHVSLASSLIQVASWINEKPRHYLTPGLALHRNSLRARIIQLLNKNNMKTQLPFYPFMFAGIIVVFVLIAWASPSITLKQSDLTETASLNESAISRPLFLSGLVQDTVPDKSKSSQAKLEKQRAELEMKMKKLAEKHAEMEHEMQEKMEKQQIEIEKIHEKIRIDQEKIEELQQSLEKEREALEKESKGLLEKEKVIEKESAGLQEKEKALEEKARTIEKSAMEMEKVMRELEFKLQENTEKQAVEIERDARKLEEQMRVLEVEMEAMEEKFEENMKRFESELKKMLQSDKILTNPDDFESLEWNDSQLKINGNLLPERLQSRYIELLGNYFDLTTDQFRYHK